jgi:hypothetical protein
MFPWILACRHEPEPWEPTPTASTLHTADTGTPVEIFPGPSGWDTCGTLRSVSLLSGPDREAFSAVSPTAEGGSDLVAWFDGPLTLEAGGPGEITLVPVGESATLLARLAPDGSLRWARQLDGTSQASIQDVASAPEGGVYAAGSGDALSSFVPGEPLGGQGEADAFVARFGSEGELLWTRSFGSPGDDRIYAVAATPDGGALVGGSFAGTAVLSAGEPSERALELPGEARSAGFLARYSPEGALLWASVLGGSETTSVTELLYDSEQDILLAQGNLSGEGVTTFGAGTPQERALDPDSTDAWLGRFDGEGTFSWVADVGGGLTYPTALGLGPGGVALMAGTAYGEVVFGRGEPGERLLEAESWPSWLAAYEDGHLSWLHVATSTGNVDFDDLATLPSGEIVVLGAFSDAIVLGEGGPDPLSLATMSGRDGLLVTLDAQGRPRCAIQMEAQPEGLTSYLSPEALAVRGDGGIEVVGELSGSAWLGAEGEVRLNSLSDDGIRLIIDLL